MLHGVWWVGGGSGVSGVGVGFGVGFGVGAGVGSAPRSLGVGVWESVLHAGRVPESRALCVCCGPHRREGMSSTKMLYNRRPCATTMLPLWRLSAGANLTREQMHTRVHTVICNRARTHKHTDTDSVDTLGMQPVDADPACALVHTCVWHALRTHSVDMLRGQADTL